MLLLGAGLRLVWVEDIEYKQDEAWTFERTQRAGLTEPWPALGMPTSVGIPNPGMSIWVFLGLGKLFAVRQPTDLARAVQVVNIVALLLMLGFVLWLVPPQEREPWLWAVALLSVNPLAVLFQRKIWPPSVLLIFTVPLLAGWWRRQQRWGAFSWGLCGVVLGQIHLSGFFFTAGFALWALLFDRRQVRWLAWLAGCGLGAAFLVSWALNLGAGEFAGASQAWWRVLEGKFWIRWVTEPWGITLNYSLVGDFGDFLASPRWGGRPTWLLGCLHGALLIALLVALMRSAVRCWRNSIRGIHDWSGRASATSFTQNAALLGFGVLLTLSGLKVQHHYTTIAMPLMFVWLARLFVAQSPSPEYSREEKPLRWGRFCLAAVCVAQFIISAAFLGYIHQHHGPIRGDYGLPYRAQQDLAASASRASLPQ
jgi:hypothetical protein